MKRRPPPRPGTIGERIWRALEGRALTVRDLAAEFDVSVQRIESLLLPLRRHGYVEPAPPMEWCWEPAVRWRAARRPPPIEPLHDLDDEDCWLMRRSVVPAAGLPRPVTRAARSVFEVAA